MASIIYSPKDIFEQEFKISMRGFDRAEVDEFLDNVISDYELFMAEIDKLKAENSSLKAKIKELEEVEIAPEFPEAPVYEAAKPAHSVTVAPVSPVKAVSPTNSLEETAEKIEVVPTPEVSPNAVSNFDILRRLSRLEKEVFGKQIVE